MFFEEYSQEPIPLNFRKVRLVSVVGCRPPSSNYISPTVSPQASPVCDSWVTLVSVFDHEAEIIFFPPCRRKPVPAMLLVDCVVGLIVLLAACYHK
jgi:hypothetical protein